MNTLCFRDKTVLITGTSSGIGRGTAIEFASKGANLVLGGRNEEQLNETKRECVKAGLNEKQVLLVAGDICKEAVQKKLIDEAINNFNRLDVLVNNAGILSITNVVSMKIEDFDEVHNVNLRAPINLTLLALPHLIKTKGNVVNVSSNAAWFPIVGFLAYGISKAALDMFTKSLAFEVASHGVRVNSINPGVVPTNINRERGLAPEQIAELYKNLGPTNPLGRNGQIKEVVDCILFLASDSSSFVTGQLLGVDGGAGLGGVRF